MFFNSCASSFTKIQHWVFAEVSKIQLPVVMWINAVVVELWPSG